LIDRERTLSKTRKIEKPVRRERGISNQFAVSDRACIGSPGSATYHHISEEVKGAEKTKFEFHRGEKIRSRTERKEPTYYQMLATASRRSKSNLQWAASGGWGGWVWVCGVARFYGGRSSGYLPERGRGDAARP